MRKQNIEWSYYMKILLACSAGMSTSLLEQAMNKYVKSENLDISITAHDSATAKNILHEYDVILLGPQVRFMLKEFQNSAPDKAVAVIPMQMYGMVKGDEVVKLAQELAKK